MFELLGLGHPDFYVRVLAVFSPYVYMYVFIYVYLCLQYHTNTYIHAYMHTYTVYILM